MSSYRETSERAISQLLVSLVLLKVEKCLNQIKISLLQVPSAMFISKKLSRISIQSNHINRNFLSSDYYLDTILFLLPLLDIKVVIHYIVPNLDFL